MALALFWIALGVYTPLFSVLYRYAPGFSYFRSPSKFAYDGLLFLAMLSAFGADALIRSARGTQSPLALSLPARRCSVDSAPGCASALHPPAGIHW